MMFPEPPFKRQFEFTPLLPEGTLGQLGHFLRCRLASDQLPQDKNPGHAESVARDAGKLDVCSFEQLQESIALGGPSLDQLAPIASQIAQFANLLGRHEAFLQQTVPQEI